MFFLLGQDAHLCTHMGILDGGEPQEGGAQGWGDKWSNTELWRRGLSYRGAEHWEGRSHTLSFPMSRMTRPPSASRQAPTVPHCAPATKGMQPKGEAGVASER